MALVNSLELRGFIAATDAAEARAAMDGLAEWINSHLAADKERTDLIAVALQANCNERQTHTALADFLTTFGQTLQQSIQAQEQLRLQRQQQWDVWRIGWELDQLNQTLKRTAVNEELERSQRELQRAVGKGNKVY
jgi:trehalose-6-phosphate synthase